MSASLARSVRGYGRHRAGVVGLRRSYALHLTAKGRTVQKRATRAFDAAVDEFFGPLTSVERKALADMLTRMILAAQAKLA